MPLFGERQDHAADDQAARTRLEWAEGAPPADIAAELTDVVLRESGDYRDMAAKELIEWLLFPGRPELNTKDVKRAVGSADELERAVSEAIQPLEHAELILVCKSR
jgi:hypothetical protein